MCNISNYESAVLFVMSCGGLKRLLLCYCLKVHLKESQHALSKSNVWLSDSLETSRE